MTSSVRQSGSNATDTRTAEKAKFAVARVIDKKFEHRHRVVGRKPFLLRHSAPQHLSRSDSALFRKHEFGRMIDAHSRSSPALTPSQIASNLSRTNGLSWTANARGIRST